MRSDSVRTQERIGARSAVAARPDVRLGARARGLRDARLAAPELRAVRAAREARPALVAAAPPHEEQAARVPRHVQTGLPPLAIPSVPTPSPSQSFPYQIFILNTFDARKYIHYTSHLTRMES